jgi:hypothetical protein
MQTESENTFKSDVSSPHPVSVSQPTRDCKMSSLLSKISKLIDRCDRKTFIESAANVYEKIPRHCCSDDELSADELSVRDKLTHQACDSSSSI